MPEKVLNKSLDTPVADDTALFGRIVNILEDARTVKAADRMVCRIVNKIPLDESFSYF